MGRWRDVAGRTFSRVSRWRGRAGRVFSRQPTLRRSWMQLGARGWLRWGFCTIRSRLAAYRRRVVLLMVQFPLFGDGEAATHSGVAPKLSTTSAKSGDNGLSWARWSTFWAQRCLAWRVVRTRTPEHAREPLETHVNPSTCAWARTPTCISSGSRAHEGAQATTYRVNVRSDGRG